MSSVTKDYVNGEYAPARRLNRSAVTERNSCESWRYCFPRAPGIILAGQQTLVVTLAEQEHGNLLSVSRRDFLRGAAVVAGAATAGPWLATGTAGADAALAVAPAAIQDRWLGPDFWANRLQDWVLRSGRITCVGVDSNHLRGRTASVLTRSLTGGRFHLQVRMGTEVQGDGFSGFLVGTGRRAPTTGARHWSQHPPVKPAACSACTARMVASCSVSTPTS